MVESKKALSSKLMVDDKKALSGKLMVKQYKGSIRQTNCQKVKRLY